MNSVLLSVPSGLEDYLRSRPGQAAWGARLREAAGGEPVFVGADPRTRRLGSGGGTVNLLAEAWRAEGRRRPPLGAWLRGRQRLVLHAGGESRRLPAYAALGKAFIPMPSVDGLTPRRFDQMLADFQMPAYRQVLREAGSKACAMVASGDVWLDFDPLLVPPATADITGIGMRVEAEVARHFGVYFVEKDAGGARSEERPIVFFRQKPAEEELHRLSARYDFYVDTGMWLLSAEALTLLFARCGWSEKRQAFATADGHPAYLDLYTEIGSALGSAAEAPPALRRLGWRNLKASVIALEEASFYHLGSSRQLFESFGKIQRGRLSPRKALCTATSTEAYSASSPLPTWLDGVEGRVRLRCEGNNVVTGLPRESGVSNLEPGWCLEAAPVGRGRWVLRPYHVDDSLRGAPGAGATICGQDARVWLSARGLTVPEADVFELAIYPVLAAAEIDQDMVAWFFSGEPEPEIGARLAGCQRLSAARIAGAVDFTRLFAARDAAHASALQGEFAECLLSGDTRVLAQDMSAVAAFCRRSARPLGRWLRRQRRRFEARISRPEHRSRLLLLLAGLEPGPRRKSYVEAGFRSLCEAVVASNPPGRSLPRRTLKDDQIVWARSPVRLDLAGGWTDTPPHCFESGGSVLNVAVLLNGQPPIQVFVRSIREPRFRLRSIDLGATEDIGTFAGLSSHGSPSSGFSLARAALSTAGFHPDFVRGRPPASLRAQLAALGGGLEISLLSAVPKGSGLGTSSILGAALLGALNRACGLGWDEVDLYKRVLGIEQLLTTGGGWQDQAGALFPGVKLIQTQPGLGQTPTVRYLPERLMAEGAANGTMLLYYTGVTRLAKGILKEIVHDMFLARTATLRTLGLIRSNALHLHRALQEGDRAGLNRCIARSWSLNQRLDPGTTTPQIERILARCGADLSACKLLGAGGGGYVLLCAADTEAGRRIRERLEARPPNSRARFVDFSVSSRALEVTVS